VSDERQVVAFRDAVTAQHGTKHVNLLFNNAGIAGGRKVRTSLHASQHSSALNPESPLSAWHTPSSRFGSPESGTLFSAMTRSMIS
jgi:hypothetical protein